MEHNASHRQADWLRSVELLNANGLLKVNGFWAKTKMNLEVVLKSNNKVLRKRLIFMHEESRPHRFEIANPYIF